jgi:hypothetical protein
VADRAHFDQAGTTVESWGETAETQRGAEGFLRLRGSRPHRSTLQPLLHFGATPPCFDAIVPARDGDGENPIRSGLWQYHVESRLRMSGPDEESPSMPTMGVTPAAVRWAARFVASTLGSILAACGGSVAAHGGPDASDAGGAGGRDGPGADAPIVDGTLADAPDALGDGDDGSAEGDDGSDGSDGSGFCDDVKALSPPEFSPFSFCHPADVTITCHDFPPTGNGRIYYTTDNTLPTHQSLVYLHPLQISSYLTIRAICSDPADCFIDSRIAVYNTLGPPMDCRDAGTVSPEAGSGRVPVNHRPNDNQCLGPAPAGNCAGGGGMLGGNFKCLHDGDCAAGTNGRCGNPGGPAGCYCSYDTCTQDADCPTGQTCACHASPYNDFGNTCVPGNCRVDSDCGASGYCSPTAPAGGWCGDVAGYYCHTPNDLCLDDSDCFGADAGTTAGTKFCEYSTTNRRWECQIVAVCL